MAHVEVAVGVFRAGIVSVLRQSRSVPEIPIRAYVIERVRIGVTGHRAQAVIVARVQRGLQSVVVRAIDISHLKDVG